MKKILLTLICVFWLVCPATQAALVQTDPGIIFALEIQTETLRALYEKRNKTQERIIEAEATVTAAMERLHALEDKMLNYMSNAQMAVQNLHQIKEAGELVVQIYKNFEKVSKAVSNNLVGTAVTAIVSDKIKDFKEDIVSLTAFMTQLVQSGTYNVTGADGKNEKHKVNLLNAAERYYVCNTVVTRLRSMNRAMWMLSWQVQCLGWRDLLEKLDPVTFYNAQYAKTVANTILRDWNRG